MDTRRAVSQTDGIRRPVLQSLRISFFMGENAQGPVLT